MKRSIAWLVAPLLACTVLAQVDLDLTMERQAFLPAEDIEVGVRLANFTGHTLKLGDQPGWLQFTVEEMRGRITGKLADPPESGEFSLEQSTRGTLRFNLTPLFAIDDPGVYRVVATVHLSSGEEFSSKPQSFEVISGVRLNEPREVGVKLADGTTERRKFVLQRVSFLKRIQLYLRITDPSEGRTFKVAPLGAMVSFDRPQWLVDRETHFHILHRTDSNNYLYHVFNGDGLLTVRQLWVAGDAGRPELQVNDSGEVRVFGAVRRLSPGDVPRPPEGPANAGSDTNAPAGGGRSTTKTNDVPTTKQP